MKNFLKNVNSNYEKTEKIIFSTLEESLKENISIYDLKVTKFCSDAKIARETFYNHYDNMEQLAKVYTKELLHDLYNIQIKNIEDMKIFFDTFTNIIIDKKDIFKLLVKDRKNYSMFEDIENYQANNLSKIDNKLSITFTFIFGGYTFEIIDSIVNDNIDINIINKIAKEAIERIETNE